MNLNSQQTTLDTKPTHDTVENVVNGICNLLKGRSLTIHYPPNQKKNSTFDQLAVSGAILAIAIAAFSLSKK